MAVVVSLVVVLEVIALVYVARQTSVELAFLQDFYRRLCPHDSVLVEAWAFVLSFSDHHDSSSKMPCRRATICDVIFECGELLLSTNNELELNESLYITLQRRARLRCRLLREPNVKHHLAAIFRALSERRGS